MFTTILVQPLFNILFAFYALIPGHDFGVAVIALTILVRIILWPLVTKQLHSQKVLRQLQPRLAEIKAKAGGDRQKEVELQMELYKEHGTNPLASLLLMIIQLPLLFALYYALRDSVSADHISRLGYDFVKDLGPVKDILNHQTHFSPTLFGKIDLTHPNALLAFLAASAQFYQTKQLQPKNADKSDPQVRLMSSMIFIFPVITFFIGLQLPAALALYWAVTSLVASFQQYWVLLRDAEELEAGKYVEGEVVKSSSGQKQLSATSADEVVVTTKSTAAATKPKAKPKRKRSAK